METYKQTNDETKRTRLKAMLEAARWEEIQQVIVRSPDHLSLNTDEREAILNEMQQAIALSRDRLLHNAEEREGILNEMKRCGVDVVFCAP